MANVVLIALGSREPAKWQMQWQDNTFLVYFMWGNSTNTTESWLLWWLSWWWWWWWWWWWRWPWRWRWHDADDDDTDDDDDDDDVPIAQCKTYTHTHVFFIFVESLVQQSEHGWGLNSVLNVYCASMSDLYYYIYNIYFFYTQYYGSVSDFYICLYIYTHIII